MFNRHMRRALPKIAAKEKRASDKISKRGPVCIISLKVFEKFNELTPRMVEYLGDVRKKITNELTKKRIDTILQKPHLNRDPILDFDTSVKPRYSDRKYRELGYESEEDFKIKNEVKELVTSLKGKGVIK